MKMVDKVVEAVINTFEKNESDIKIKGVYEVSIVLEEMDYRSLALKLTDLGFTALIIEEAGDMILNVYKKYF